MSTMPAPTDILVAYVSTSGSTQSVAETLADALREAGCSVALADLTTLDDPAELSPTSARAVVLGSGVYHDSFHDRAVVWLERHRQALADVPVALFSCSASAALPDATAQQATHDIARRLPTDPVAIRDFPGWIRPELLNEEDRAHVESYGARHGDFRDLDAVRAWGSELATQLS